MIVVGMQMVTHRTVQIAGHIDHDVKIAGDHIIKVRQLILVYVMTAALIAFFEVTVERRRWARQENLLSH